MSLNSYKGGVQMAKELLQETPIFEDIELESLDEAQTDGTRLYKIRGTASRGDMFNKNNRMYPTSVLKKVAEKIQPLIKKGKMTGQLDHPSWFDDGGLKGTAIKFTNMWMEKDDLKFEGNVLPTTPGKELAALLESKVGIGMSTRGYGTMKPYKLKSGKEHKNKMVVQDDYELYGVDAVLHESNQYGKVAQFENKKGGPNVEDMDIKTLKEEHPELVEELKSELQADLDKTFDAKVAEEVEKQVKEAKEAAKQEALESDEVKQKQEFINSLVESVKPFIPGQKEYVESERQKEIDELNAKLKDAEEAKDSAVKEAADLKAEKEKSEEKAKVDTYIEEKVKGHRFANQLKTRLKECATKEEVDSKFDQEVEFIESLVKDKEEPTGSGKVEDKKEDNSTDKMDEEKERQRKLAGISENSKEGGK